jgi:ABC-2 type transport system permease protein
VLAAQVIVNLALAVIAIVILVAGGVLFFGVHMPAQWGGFVLSALLCTAAMFGIGLLISSLARSPQVAGVVGTVLLYPLLFFAGM